MGLEIYLPPNSLNTLRVGLVTTSIQSLKFVSRPDTYLNYAIFINEFFMLNSVVLWDSWANASWIKLCKEIFSNGVNLEPISDIFTSSECDYSLFSQLDRFMFAQLLFSSTLENITAAKFSFSNSFLNSFTIVEIVSCSNISISLYSQLDSLKTDHDDDINRQRIIVQDNEIDNNNNESEQRNTTSKFKKEAITQPQKDNPFVYKLVLSDGKNLIEAVDLYGIIKQVLPKGYKMALSSGIELQRNVLILHPGHVLCLGGSLPLKNSSHSHLFDSVEDLKQRLRLKNNQL